jgi:hypothetical protein
VHIYPRGLLHHWRDCALCLRLGIHRYEREETGGNKSRVYL